MSSRSLSRELSFPKASTASPHGSEIRRELIPFEDLILGSVEEVTI